MRCNRGSPHEQLIFWDNTELHFSEWQQDWMILKIFTYFMVTMTALFTLLSRQLLNYWVSLFCFDEQTMLKSQLQIAAFALHHAMTWIDFVWCCQWHKKIYLPQMLFKFFWHFGARTYQKRSVFQLILKFDHSSFPILLKFFTHRCARLGPLGTLRLLLHSVLSRKRVRQDVADSGRQLRVLLTESGFLTQHVSAELHKHESTVIQVNLLPLANEVMGKVMFSQVHVCPKACG